METLLSIARKSDDQAREYLEDVRWADGRYCPHCGGVKTGALNGVKDKKGNTRRGLYKCYTCRKQFTVTVGTVMHKSKISLQAWIVAFYLVSSGKKGVAALEIQRVLGIGSYETAWYMVQRIREAMLDEPQFQVMGGVIEADETYIGGETRIGKRGRGSERKTPVVAVIERDGTAVVQPMKRVTADNLKTMIRELAHPSAEIHTDEFLSYKGIGAHFEGGHQTVCHGEFVYSAGDVHVNNCESMFALMKRGIHGTWHSVSKKHLARYADEFAFRWNTRKVTDTERAEALIDRSSGRQITYNELIGKA